MTKFIYGVATLALGFALFALTGEAKADSRYHRNRDFYGRGVAPTRAYYVQYGTKYRNGYYYRGQHDHWGWKVWNGRYNRYHYWDAGLKCYYYYCPVRAGYYPISDCD